MHVKEAALSVYLIGKVDAASPIIQVSHTNYNIKIHEFIQKYKKSTHCKCTETLR